MAETVRGGRPGPNLAILRAQEEERRRVARELHDGPAQLLANVVLRIDVCQRLAEQDPKRLKDELQQLKDLLRLTLQEVRQVIFDLRPMALDDLGLVPALRAYIQEYQKRTALQVEFTVHGTERRLGPDLEVGLFRLVQEALTNVHRHARATRAEITVEWGPDEVKVTVADDGIGFDPAQVQASGREGHFGLRGMAERAALLGGRLAIDSRPGAGTRIAVAIPTGGGAGHEGEAG
ncbi:MAG: sensor histidine kinase [Bacillota bacterium]